MRLERVRNLNDKDVDLSKGRVVYWMSRDMRMYDNWAFVHAFNLAKENNLELLVVYWKYVPYKNISKRIYSYRDNILERLKNQFWEKNIGFEIFDEGFDDFLKYLSNSASVVVCDFCPLRGSLNLRSKASKKLNISVQQVDASNIVPVWIASDKKEYGAYTIRPKIVSKINYFMDEYPREFLDIKKTDLDFLDRYSGESNDPIADSQSGLSAKIHFGEISVQSLAQKTQYNKDFFEQVVIRRELAQNFCFYDTNYDNEKCFPDWALDSLKLHLGDKREYLYTSEQFEASQTHDTLWNTAQSEMVKTGKMHGYMRMYWAKKILEWTKDYKEAQRIAIYLNDKYELDGRDPNGYAGIAWAIGGVHDRPWSERLVFGKIRYMNLAGCKRKFDVDAYIKKINSL